MILNNPTNQRFISISGSNNYKNSNIETATAIDNQQSKQQKIIQKPKKKELSSSSLSSKCATSVIHSYFEI
ncbi:hypothetical protein DERP_005073 [Dermatophagoides pteronyssinus]|uniref:Uncharacterized protein n=1 Tax=Dermatophagoides pteronyssinus TaxID=6956 RepID=A0ABQ8JTB3_DERPT|nr:hypothetical protein DERP_005073 [Dermatophagoides pteronyssinus]